MLLKYHAYVPIVSIDEHAIALQIPYIYSRHVGAKARWYECKLCWIQINMVYFWLPYIYLQMLPNKQKLHGLGERGKQATKRSQNEKDKFNSIGRLLFWGKMKKTRASNPAHRNRYQHRRKCWGNDSIQGIMYQIEKAWDLQQGGGKEKNIWPGEHQGNYLHGWGRGRREG